MSDKFIPMICPQCGGKIKFQEQDQGTRFVIAGDTVVILATAEVTPPMKCEHCGTEFLPGKTLQKDTGAMNVVGDGNVAIQGNGNTVVTTIKGNVTGPVFTGRFDGPVHIGLPSKPNEK